VADIDPAGRETRLARNNQSRRSSSRDSLFLAATIRRKADGAGELSPARVRNLSAVGVMVDYADAVEPGESVIVTVRGIGSVPGKVAWVRRGRIGIAFDLEVDPKLARKPVRAASATASTKRPAY
jgi:hypothetical protein